MRPQDKIARKSQAVLLSLLLTGLAFADGVHAQKKTAVASASPMQLMQSGRYTQALPYFKDMAQKDARDMSVQYYLGLCAEGARDYGLAEAALCKVVVASQPASVFAINARKVLARLPGHLQPQCCIQNNQTHRWSPAANPIRIYISDGRDLPPQLSGGVISQAEYKMAQTIIKTSLYRQPITPSYKPVYAQYVRDGISGWDWAVREKLFSYTYVNDPRRADIVVLFCERCKNNDAGFSLFPWEFKQSELLWIACAKPTADNSPDQKIEMAQVAAHEFGHCLGLQHTDVVTDLMNHTVRRIPDGARWDAETVTTPNDRASLRALYSMPATMTFPPAE